MEQFRDKFGIPTHHFHKPDPDQFVRIRGTHLSGALPDMATARPSNAGIEYYGTGHEIGGVG
jgi:hypothetical protein